MAGSNSAGTSDLAPVAARRAVTALLTAQGLLFCAMASSGSDDAWGSFSPLHAEVAADLLPGGASPWDAYDGLVSGPLAMALLEAPLLAALGRIGLVHVLVCGAIALGLTWLTWRFLSQAVSRRAGLVAAALVAFPPPNTWYHQHQGAHHLLGLMLVPAGLLLLGRLHEPVRRAPVREVAGWTLLAGSVAVAPPSICFALPLGVLWWAIPALRGPPGERAIRLLRRLPPVLAGGALASAPLLYKGLLHRPYGGAELALTATEATKPLFRSVPPLPELPGRIASMVTIDFPYGLHFGLHGMDRAGVLWAIAGGLAFAWLVWRLVRGAGELGWGPLLLVPPAVLVVGVLTGWFVFHPGEGEPFPRDSRHVLGLTLALSWLMGAALDELPRGARPSAWVLVGVLVAASVTTQVRATDWNALGSAEWRLEGRLLQGFFAGPLLADQPETANDYCSAHPEPRRSDCLLGVALAIGEGPSRAVLTGDTGALGSMRLRCIALMEEAQVIRPADCFAGLGFGFSHTVFREPGKAIGTCRTVDGMADPERDACVRGVAWGVAQDFWNRPSAMQRWLLESADEAELWSEGVGGTVARFSRSSEWVAETCERLVGPELSARCVASARKRTVVKPTAVP